MIFTDPTIQVVGLFTLADSRPAQIRRALANKKHVMAEKPIGADVKTEWELVKEIEASDRLVGVNPSTATRGTTKKSKPSSPRARSASSASSGSAI